MAKAKAIRDLATLLKPGVGKMSKAEERLVARHHGSAMDGLKQDLLQRREARGNSPQGSRLSGIRDAADRTGKYGPGRGAPTDTGVMSGAGYTVDPNRGAISNFASSMKQRLNNDIGDGWEIGKAALGHAARGAVGGAAIGGTVEAAQGGSFWAGAKEGAFNGAAAWTGVRMLGRATGATQMNPFGRSGAVRTAASQYGAVSKQVSAIQLANQGASMNAKVMSGLGGV